MCVALRLPSMLGYHLRVTEDVRVWTHIYQAIAWAIRARAVAFGRLSRADAALGGPDDPNPSHFW